MTEAETLQEMFSAFDHRLRTIGYLAMIGQIVDTTLIAAPKLRDTQEEQESIKTGQRA